MDVFKLSRNWFDFAFEKKEAKSFHTAMFCWLVELNNRMGWKEEFGLPTRDTMDGLKIGNRNTYHSILKDLQSWGFIKIVQEAKNQYQSMFVTICHTQNEQAVVSALDQALVRQRTSSGVGSVPIYKQGNNETVKPKNKAKVFIAPSVEEVCAFFLEHGWRKELAEKAFNYYARANWKDGNQKQVKDWKRKMSTVWFDEDKNGAHKIQQAAPTIENRKPVSVDYKTSTATYSDGKSMILPTATLKEIEAELNGHG